MRDGTLTRKRLERCALTLFVEQGIHATTIKDIATSAGIAEGTLYRHYTSKEELAESLFLKAHESIANHVKKEIEKFSSLKDKLKFMVHFFCEKYDEDPIVFNYLLLAQHHQMQILKKADYSAHAQLVSVVNEAIKKKELSKRDPDFYASVILGIILQAALSRVYGRITRKMTEDAEDLVSAIEGAIFDGSLK